MPKRRNPKPKTVPPKHRLYHGGAGRLKGGKIKPSSKGAWGGGVVYAAGTKRAAGRWSGRHKTRGTGPAGVHTISNVSRRFKPHEGWSATKGMNPKALQYHGSGRTRPILNAKIGRRASSPTSIKRYGRVGI